jgi:hypothetical protein
MLLLITNLTAVYSEDEISKESNFETFDDLTAAKIFLALPERQIRLGFKDSSGYEYEYYEYSAATDAVLGLAVTGVKYNIEFSTATITNNIDFEDDDTYGKTDYYKGNISFYENNLAIKGYYNRIKGYFLLNPEGLYPQWDSDDPYPQRRDMSSDDAGFSFTWKFSDDFSYKAAVTQGERQRKSGGSWLVGAQYNYLRLRTDSSLIPDDQISNYEKNAVDFRGGTFHSLTLYFGGAYTFVFFKNFYASISLAAGPSYTKQHWKLSSGSRNTYMFSFLSASTPGWLNIGYNGDSFICGLNYLWMNGVSTSSISVEGIEINSVTNMDIELFAGARF